MVGASPTQGSFGRRTLENLRNFTGAVYGIHPKHREILGRPTFAKLADLPEVPDCVIVCVGQNLTEPVIKEAADLGIVTRVVGAAQVMDEALAFASQLASGPTLTLGRIKQNLALAEGGGSLAECFDSEARNHILSSLTSDHKEAAAAFVEKRKPVFTGS